MAAGVVAGWQQGGSKVAGMAAWKQERGSRVRVAARWQQGASRVPAGKQQGSIRVAARWQHWHQKSLATKNSKRSQGSQGPKVVKTTAYI